MVLIRVGSLACLAASVSPAVSTSLVATAYGGRPQSLDPTLGDVYCTLAMTLSTEAAAVRTTAFLLAASGIRYLNLRDVVAVC